MIDHIANDCLIRGGCFWSDNNRDVIAGKIGHGKVHDFKEFIQKLNITI
jgi:hypothetical protein